MQQDRQVGLRDFFVEVGGPPDRLSAEPPLVHVGVVVRQHRTAGAELPPHQLDRGLTLIGYVRLIGNTEQQHMRALQRLRVAVEQLGGPVGGVHRHPAVNLLGELDKPERVAERPDLVGQVVRIDRYEVPPTPGPGWKAWKPKGFVAAHRMASRKSTPSSWQKIAISFTSAMLTCR